MTSIRIKDIDIYHPSNQVDNEHYINHFKETKGEDPTSFITQVLGRKDRYIVDNDDENTLTMGVQAAKKVLAKSNTDAKDLDMIIFATQIPEYTFPTNAVILHNEIGAGNKTGVLDLNANCSGMTIALEQASRYLLSNPRMEKLLLVGSDYLSLIAEPDNSTTYPAFGDIACAIILEKVEDDNCGLVDSIYYTDSSIHSNVTFPKGGLSKQILKHERSKYMQWLPFDGALCMPFAYDIIDEMLDRNDLKPNDIDAYCLSQFSTYNIKKVQEHYNLPADKMIYAGDKYGYSGTSSPLIALHEGIENGSIKRGDKVLFWTVGIGYTLIAVVYQY